MGNSSTKSRDSKEIDDKILNYLSENARATYREIAEKLNISESTVRNRILKLIKNKTIEKFSVKLDLEKLGNYFGWILKIKIDSSQVNAIIDNLFGNDNIIGIYEVSGDENLIIMGYNKSLKNLENFLKKNIYNLDGVYTIKFEIFIDNIK